MKNGSLSKLENLIFRDGDFSRRQKELEEIHLSKIGMALRK